MKIHGIIAEISLWAVAYSWLLTYSCSTIPSHAFVIHIPHSTRRLHQKQQSTQRQDIRASHSRLWQSLPSDSALTDGITTSKTMEQQDQQLQAAVQELKSVLYEEYTSMFNPMRREFYASNVTFDDPLTQLQGVDAYQSNVDLLGSRTWLGAILFENSNIVLHSVKGGDVVVMASSSQQQHGDGVQVTDITTRWTLSMTFRALPWKPTARFTGVSIYKTEPYYDKEQTSWRVRVLRQQDYWDSINLQQGGTYQKVDTQRGLQDLLRQFFTIPMSEQEQSQRLPYQLLRRAKTYQVRRYPSFTALQVDNTDGGDRSIREALQSLAAKGSTNALRPVVVNLRHGDNRKNVNTNIDSWWLPFSRKDGAAIISNAHPQTESSDIGSKWVTVPSQVVAVAECDSLENVKEVEQTLRANLDHDGIQVSPKGEPATAAGLQQWAIFDDPLDPTVITTNEQIYDRRKQQHTQGEVWLTLPDLCHPWSE